MKQDHRACRLLPRALGKGSNAEWQKGGFIGTSGIHCWGKGMCRKEEQALTGAVWRLHGLGNPAAGATAEELIWASAETRRGQNELWAWVGKLEQEHCLEPPQVTHCTNSVPLLSIKGTSMPRNYQTGFASCGPKGWKVNWVSWQLYPQSLVCEWFPL